MKSDSRLHLALLALLALIASAPLLGSLYPFGHSSLIDITRLVEVDIVTRAGDPTSPWMPDFYFGYGSPLLRYYAPAPYWAAEAFHLAGLPLLAALKGVYLLALLAAAWGAYFLFREIWSPAGGVLAGAVYLLAPYRIVNIYVRSAIGETLALGVLPWVFWALLAYQRRGGGRRLSAAAATTGGLVLAHNLTAFIAFPFLPLVTLLAPRGERARALARCLVALLIGGLLSGIYWYPALAGKRDVLLTESTTTGFFNYHKHFVSPFQLLSPVVTFGGSDEGVEEEMPLPLPVFPLVLAVIVLLEMMREPGGEKRSALWPGLILLAVPTFMTLSFSRPVWEALGPLHFVQFPWRYLGLASLGIAWLAGGLFRKTDGADGRTAGILAAVVLVSVHPFIRCDYLVVSPVLLTGEGIAASGERSTAYHEYLPTTVRQLPEKVPESRYSWLTGSGELDARPSRGNHHAVAIDGPGGVLEVRYFWFPGWRGEWNGRPLALRPSVPGGTILATIPPGRGTLTLRYAGDPLRRPGLAVTLAGLALLALAVREERFRGRP